MRDNRVGAATLIHVLRHDYVEYDNTGGGVAQGGPAS